MVLFIRDNECHEPRVTNYLNYFKNNGIDYKVIAWNRSGTAALDDHFDFLERRAEYGKRIANIPNKLIWMFFVIKEIIKNRKECKVIHACDIDAILPALIIGKILRKTIVFDIFDWISSLNGKGIVYKIVDALQNSAYKRSDYVIICEEERKEQAHTKCKKLLVLPNIPSSQIVYDKQTEEIINSDRNKYRLVLSYVGVFDRDRGLENLLECMTELPDIKLNIAGFGVISDLVEEYAQKYDNILCWNRVEYSVGQTILKNSDLMAAMYHTTSPLHKFAAPNKYYESLMLQVPLITTQDTLVGDKVKKYDTGFVLDESKESLLNLLKDKETKSSSKTKADNCKTVWENIYCNYFNSFMQSEYAEILSKGEKRK